jgi:antitoxin component of MazEF toxin-antitoxin module
MAQVTIGRWGNDLAVGLPGEVVDAARLKDGDRVEIEARQDEVVIRPAVPRIALADLFRGKAAQEWRADYAGAYDWGPDVAREIVPE